MGLLLTFTQLEFTHAIGPHAATYLVAPTAMHADRVNIGHDDVARTGALDPLTARLTGIRRGPATTDVLIVAVDEAPVARGRRRGGAAPTPTAGAVPLTVVTHVRATAPLANDDAGRACMDRWRAFPEEREPLISEALDVINVAIRAHRVATGDPYTIEVAREDARTVRLGYGHAEDLRRGAWTDAVVCARPRNDGGATDSPTFVSAVLRGHLRVRDSEDLLLRLLLDRRHGRERAAAVQARAALELLAHDLRADGTHELAATIAGLSPAAERLYVRALSGPIDPESSAELDALIAAMETALDAVRTSADAKEIPGATDSDVARCAGHEL